MEQDQKSIFTPHVRPFYLSRTVQASRVSPPQFVKLHRYQHIEVTKLLKPRSNVFADEVFLMQRTGPVSCISGMRETRASYAQRYRLRGHGQLLRVGRLVWASLTFTQSLNHIVCSRTHRPTRDLDQQRRSCCKMRLFTTLYAYGSEGRSYSASVAFEKAVFGGEGWGLSSL